MSWGTSFVLPTAHNTETWPRLSSYTMYMQLELQHTVYIICIFRVENPFSSCLKESHSG